MEQTIKTHSAEGYTSTAGRKANNYQEMKALVASMPSSAFFGEYSGLTRTYYEPKVRNKFIADRLSELDGGYMTASTHKFGASGGTEKPELVLFVKNSLKWAMQEFRFYCGQWNQAFLYGRDHHEKGLLVEEILREEMPKVGYEEFKDLFESNLPEAVQKQCYYALKGATIFASSAEWRI